jgi:hypothetical protein
MGDCSGDASGDSSAACAAAVEMATEVASAVGKGMAVGMSTGVMVGGGVAVASNSFPPHAASASTHVPSTAARLILRNMRAILLC